MSFTSVISMLIRPAAFVLAGSAVLSTSAQLPPDAVPQEMRGIELVEHLDEQLPLDLEFINEAGETVQLSEYFNADKPVILTLNYYSCPRLCHLTLTGLVEGLRGLEWTAGEEFEIVTISINPEETPEHAAGFKRRYVGEYGRDAAEDGWHFLTDKDGNVKTLAEAVGFGYRFVPETGEFAHHSSIQFITPDGRISKYMNDVMFESRDLRYALVESSQGSIGSPMDRLLLFTCFRYDPDANSYTPAAWKVMRAGGALMVLVVATGLFILWMRGSAADRSSRSGEASASLATGGTS